MPIVPPDDGEQEDPGRTARPDGPWFRDERDPAAGRQEPHDGPYGGGGGASARPGAYAEGRAAEHADRHPDRYPGARAERRAAGGAGGPGRQRGDHPTGGDTGAVLPPPTGTTGAGQPEGRQEKPAKKSAGRDLPAAIGVGVGLGAVIVVALFVYKPVFLGVIALAVVVGLWELTSRLTECKGIRAPLVPLALGGVAMVLAGYAWGPQGAWVSVSLTALAVLVWRMTQPPENYLRDVTAGVFAAFYVPFLATFVALMLAAHDGPWRVLTFLLLTVVSDTGAYAVGWRLGTHKLAPRISPGKTREGLVGAVLFAMGAGALCLQFLIDGGSWWQGLLLGLAVALSATLGDLGESMIKRDLGIKDMGRLLPGHGGIMDRLDSLLPTAPVVWLLLVVFVGSS